jgi:geranylgeranyl diphosphate synthase type I
MIGCSMAMAGMLAIDDEDAAVGLNRAGRRLGLCFQIRDDWLGIWGDSDATGKSSDNDIRRRKKTYPVVYAFEHADQEARSTLDAIYAQETLSDADVDEVLGILTLLGAGEAADAAAAAQLAAFQDEIAALLLGPAAEATFGEVAQFMLQRDR